MATLNPSRNRARPNPFLKDAQGWLFVLVPLLIYCAFVLLPLAQSVYISFTDWNGVRPVLNWVGFKNYIDVFSEPLFWKALWHNAIWVLIGTISPIAISLGLAMLIWRRTPGRTFFQSAYFIPNILSAAVIALIWNQIYHPLYGILNHALTALGLESWAIGWMGNERTALGAVLVAAIWSYFGFCLTLILAGLQSLNYDLIEASMIDGASPLDRFFNVIIPQLRPVLTMITSYTLIGGFNVFEIVWVMTKGGPANATETISTLLYRNAFVDDKVAFGTAMALVLTAISLVISVVFITLRERND
jgi:raffinose/stachyose/melibiose transport system permease protein